MTTHPAGTADLVKRLLDANVDFGLCDEVNARIEQLEAENKHLGDLYDDTCYYHTPDGRAQFHARKISALEAALTRANAATAAAYEVAARMIDSVEDAPEFADTMLSAVWDVQRNIRALATADQRSALDRLIAEAEARVWEQAVIIANKLLVRAKFGSDTLTEVVYSDFVGTAILVASKKGGA